MANFWQWLGLASRQPDNHKYILTNEGLKATKSLDFFRKYECDFFVLLHLKRFTKTGQDKGEIQEGLEPFYTEKETAESIKQVVRANLARIDLSALDIQAKSSDMVEEPRAIEHKRDILQETIQEAIKGTFGDKTMRKVPKAKEAIKK